MNPSRQDVEEAVQAVRTQMLERPDIDTPRDINEGLCADFVHLVWERLGRPDELETTDNVVEGDDEYRHTWIVCQGRHYDAEAPGGVEEWTRLPFFQRCRTEPSPWA
jgi:hypothetical protein